MEATEIKRDQLDRAGLDAQVRGGLKWASLAVMALELAAMGSTVVLARLVDPAAYGRAVIALMVPVIASILTYEGFGTPLVQRAQITRAHVEAATLISIASGVVLGGLVIVFALTIAEPIFGAGLAGLFEISSPTFLIVGCGAVSRAMLSRSLSWRLVNGADVGAAVVTGIVSITLAAAGLEARSIIIGALAGALANTMLLWLGARPARPRFDRQATRDIVGFGASTSLAGVAMTIRRNIDYVVLATQVSPHLVGIYWRGFSTGVDYQSKISGVTSRVSTMVLPRAGDADDMRAVRGRLVRMNTIVVFPFLGVLIATAPWAIPAIYGQRWAEAVVPTQVLAVAGMAWAVLAGIDGVTVASGHPGVLAVFSCISLVLVGLVAYFVAPYGIDAVAIAMAGLEIVFLFVAQYWVLWRTVGVPLRDSFRDPAPAAVCTAILVAVTWPLAALLGPHLPGLLNVVVCGGIGFLAYGLALNRLSPSGWSIICALGRTVGLDRPLRGLRRRLGTGAPLPVGGHEG